jgi:hypothetical protein
VSLHITWKGYEFIDAARDKTIWERTKTLLKDKGASVPFEVLQSLLIKAVAHAVNVA